MSPERQHLRTFADKITKVPKKLKMPIEYIIGGEDEAN